jgi:hypothetical protein
MSSVTNDPPPHERPPDHEPPPDHERAPDHEGDPMETHPFDAWSAIMGLALMAIGVAVLADELTLLDLTLRFDSAWVTPVLAIGAGALLLASAVSKRRRSRPTDEPVDDT